MNPSYEDTMDLDLTAQNAQGQLALPLTSGTPVVFGNQHQFRGGLVLRVLRLMRALRVIKLVKSGNRVVFAEGDCFIENISTKQKIPIEERNGA